MYIANFEIEFNLHVIIIIICSLLISKKQKKNYTNLQINQNLQGTIIGIIKKLLSVSFFKH